MVEERSDTIKNSERSWLHCTTLLAPHTNLNSLNDLALCFELWSLDALHPNKHNDKRAPIPDANQ
jgi:hypothetical protein